MTLKRAAWFVVVVQLAALAWMAGIVVNAQNTVNLLNTRYNAESTGNVLTLPDPIWWPAVTCQAAGGWASDWHYSTAATDAPTPTCDFSAPTGNIVGRLDFDDSATEYIYREVQLPKYWSGTIDIKLAWFTSATSGNVVWQIQTTCTADNETLAPGSITYNAAQTITDAAKGSASLLNYATLTNVTTTNCAAEELLRLKIYRDPTHGSDTIGAFAGLVGVEWTYRRAI